MDSLISALSSVVLVGVTAWYAILTNRLAKSARDSAASAERTATLTAEALAASVAALDVNFAVHPNAQGISGREDALLGVSVHCTGATVFIHRVHLDMAHRLDEMSEDGGSYTLFADDIGLAVATGRELNSMPVRLPARIHKNEVIHFETDPPVMMRPEETTGMLEVSIWYTLTGRGEPFARRVDYLIESA